MERQHGKVRRGGQYREDGKKRMERQHGKVRRGGQYREEEYSRTVELDGPAGSPEQCHPVLLPDYYQYYPFYTPHSACPARNPVKSELGSIPGGEG